MQEEPCVDIVNRVYDINFVLNLIESSLSYCMVSRQPPKNPCSLFDTLNLTMILLDIAVLLTD